MDIQFHHENTDIDFVEKKHWNNLNPLGVFGVFCSILIFRATDAPVLDFW